MSHHCGGAFIEHPAQQHPQCVCVYIYLYINIVLSTVCVTDMHGFPMHKHKPTCALYTSCPTYTHTHAQPTVYNPDKIVERESHHVLQFIGVPPYSSFFSGSLNATSLFCSLPRGYVQLNTGWCNCKVGLAMVSLPSSRPGFIWLNYFDYFCPLKLDVQLALFIGSRSPSSSNP